MFKKRIESYLLEQAVVYLMILFGFAAIALFGTSLTKDVNFANLAIIEILLIIILCILAQTVIMIRIFRQHD